jgi:protein-glucosylgalactosylhydroxylysine glucosidase
VRDLEQSYDFSTGALSSKFIFAASGNAVHCEVLTFASREDPTLVCQEFSLTAERASDLKLRAMIDAAGISGRARRQKRSTLHCAIDPSFGSISYLDTVLASGWTTSGTS